MKRYIILIIAVLIFLAVIAVIYFLPQGESSIQENQKQQSAEKVFLKVNDKNFEFDYERGITAFDLLERSGLELETKQYDIGALVESIDSVENVQDNKYWIYYVNGESPILSADKMELRAGDKVEFKFEESPF
jgi:hypothetical protein